MRRFRGISGKFIAILMSASMMTCPVFAGEADALEDIEVGSITQETDVFLSDEKGTENGRVRYNEPSDISDVNTGQSDSLEHTTGHISLPWKDIFQIDDTDLSFSAIKNAKVEDDENSLSGYTPRTEIPARYPGDNDTETKKIISGKYPKCRDQDEFGTCWAHSAVCSSEFYEITHGNADKSIDLSELYLAYGMFKNLENPVVGDDDAVSRVSSTVSDNGLLQNGGDGLFTGQFLSKGYGFINEDELPYTYKKDDKRFDENGNLNIDLDAFKDKKVLQLKDLLLTDVTKDENNRSITKEAVMQNGAVGIAFHADGKYYNSTTNAYYVYDDNKNANHEIALVGWDDNFSKENFGGTKKPEKNGAWLARNSWADENTDFYNFWSYFWISYEDPSLVGAFIYDVVKENSYDYNYYYDTQFHWMRNFDGVKNQANVFKVKGDSNQKLTEIGLEVLASTKYEIKVYRNLNSNSDPVSGTLVESATTNGDLILPGVYTIPLSSPVLLANDSYFSIVVTTDAGAVVIEESMTYGNSEVNVECGIKKNQSFYAENGSWHDLIEASENGTGNFCISAHTVDTTENECEEKFKDPSGKEVTLIYDVNYGTYKTTDGKYVLVLSMADGKDTPEPKFQFTGKKICPSKKSYVVYKGVLYSYKTDYTIGYKKNKKKGDAEVNVKWKKKSAPYKGGTKKSTAKFEVVERNVTADMVNLTVKNGQIKKIIVKADGVDMKPKKTDYSYTGSSSEGFTITFKNNYKGVVVKK